MYIPRPIRQILLDLPLGVCSLSFDDEVIMWNRALEEFTGIKSTNVVGSQLTDLNEPWLSLISNFLKGNSSHNYKNYFEVDGKKKAVTLHKAIIDELDEKDSSKNDRADVYFFEGTIILLEDITETEILEAGLTHSERLASIGRLAAGVAHEIGNPITGIACLAQTIRDEYKDKELNNLAEQIIQQTSRTSKILQSLVNFSHAGSNQTHYEKEVISVLECMEEAKTLISLDKKSKDIQFQMECDPKTKILGDTQRLLQVLVNLISNARDASPPNSTILLQTIMETDWVHIKITDEGAGISPNIKDRVFDPFFTTKEAGEGTGLGLSLAFRIVEDLDGDIDIISPIDKTNGSGTQVIMRFPCYDENTSEFQK